MLVFVEGNTPVGTNRHKRCDSQESKVGLWIKLRAGLSSSATFALPRPMQQHRTLLKLSAISLLHSHAISGVMGSYCELTFDHLNIDSWKSVVPDHMISLFQENERLVTLEKEDTEEEWKKTAYRARKEDVLLRLELMGITIERSKAAFHRWRAEQLEMYSEWDWAEDTKQALESFTIEMWMQRAQSILENRYNFEIEKEPVDETERRMMDSSYDGSWLFFACNDVRYIYRLILECCKDVKLITLDISDLVNGGYYDDDVQLIADSRSPEALEKSILEPVVIMGEGRTDIRVLRASLVALYPNVQELFSFFDHDTLSVDGGANFLVKFLKAFAAARASIKIIAVFDNDSAGRLEFEKIERLELPSNIRAICLPQIDLAESYPTIGPQGMHMMDINRSAVGIELFMGRHNLRDIHGEFFPIRWTQYYSGTQAYQGEISEKEKVQRSFFEDIASSTDTTAARERFPELNLLWQKIFESLN